MLTSYPPGPRAQGSLIGRQPLVQNISMLTNNYDNINNYDCCNKKKTYDYCAVYNYFWELD